MSAIAHCPGAGVSLRAFGPVAQGIEQLTSNQPVAGSNPAGITHVAVERLISRYTSRWIREFVDADFQDLGGC